MAETPISFIDGNHFYQPDRLARHQNVSDVWTSPDGRDWSRIGLERVYASLGELGLYEIMSYDYAPPLRREIARVADADPAIADVAQATAARMEQNLLENGVATTALHAILPHVPDIDKRILIHAGIADYVAVAGKPPTCFWLPEGAVDQRTLQLLAEAGIQAFMCAPEQVESESPCRIALEGGRSIIALPFNSALSREWAYDVDRRTNAETFASRVITPIIDRMMQNDDFRLLVLWMDGETSGMYDPQKESNPRAPGSDHFHNHLVRVALPRMGIETVSVNRVIGQMAAEQDRISVREIRANTAWSCSDGLVRWDGVRNCAESGGAEWKAPFYAAHALLNDEVTRIVRRELRMANAEQEAAFVQRVVEDFNGAFANRGGMHSPTEQSLVSAKVAALASRVSCGTFYDNPGTSGWQNMAFARAAVEHLHDAGQHSEAGQIWDRYVMIMRRIPDHYLRNAPDTLTGFAIPSR